MTTPDPDFRMAGPRPAPCAQCAPRCPGCAPRRRELPPEDQPPADTADTMPFIATRAHGGLYDTDAFAAGFITGSINTSLKIAYPAGAAMVVFPMVPLELHAQLELIGMLQGYPILTTEPSDHDPEGRYHAFTFTRGNEL